jgi:hypothetical protein
MIATITDMLDQWRRRTGRLVTGRLVENNGYVSVSLVAKAALVRAPGKIIEIKTGSPENWLRCRRIAFPENRPNDRASGNGPLFRADFRQGRNTLSAAI